MSAEYTPTETDIVRGAMYLDHNIRVELAGSSVARGIAKIKAEAKAEALREAADEFDYTIGPIELGEQSSRQEPQGRTWWAADTVDEAWENSGPIMDWLRNRADRIEREARNG